MHGPFILALWLVSGPIALTDATSGGLCTRQTSSTDAAVAEFTERVREYLRLRQDAARALPPEQVFDDPREMLAVREVLRQAIREARRDARAGDLVTASAASAFRHIVAATAAAQHVDVKDIVRELRAEQLPGATKPVVNGPYDWRLGAWMWPALLQCLPPLPEELQYRIVDEDLVLIDLRASLVIDIVEDVMDADDE